ncbi:hypothetical protein KCP74_18060 [Salmonella enterica subsp. enterica]|nr:hypothetical protein KCP74_18060 [Salmonella enterica subsp. enterica]
MFTGYRLMRPGYYAAGDGRQWIQRPIGGVLVSRLGLRLVATGGMALSALSFMARRCGISAPANGRPQLMALLDLAPPAHCWLPRRHYGRCAGRKAAAAGAIENDGLRTGRGLGTLFSVCCCRSFSASNPSACRA